MIETLIKKYTLGSVSILNPHITVPYNTGIDTRDVSCNDRQSIDTFKINQEYFDRLRILESNYVPRISKLELAQLCLDEYFEKKNKRTKYSFSIMNGGLFQEWDKNDFDI